MKTLKLVAVAAFAALAFALAANPARTAFSQSVDVELAAPTGVVASDNDYSNKVAIGWDAIRNASTYRVFRNTANDPASAVQLGTTAAAIFFDTSAVPNQTYFYWVRAENGTTSSNLSLS